MQVEGALLPHLAQISRLLSFSPCFLSFLCVLLVALLELGLGAPLLGVGDDERGGREGSVQSFSL